MPSAANKRRRTAARARKKQRKPFNFFELPQELRDIIYREMLEDVKFVTQQKFDCQATNIANSQHLLASRRFKSELGYVCNRISSLTISDTEHVSTKHVLNCAEGLPEAAFTVSSLQINIRHDGEVCKKAIGFRKHLVWIEAVVKRMASLKILSVKSLYWNGQPDPVGVSGIWRQSTCSSNKKRCSSFEVFGWQVEHDTFDFDRQTNVLYRWSKEKRYLEEVKRQNGSAIQGTIKS